jgi:hypothetical protein
MELLWIIPIGYILPIITAWITTRAFMKQKNKVPALGDALIVFCPVINIYSTLYYCCYLESRIDTSKFFRLKKVKK